MKLHSGIAELEIATTTGEVGCAECAHAKANIMDMSRKGRRTHRPFLPLSGFIRRLMTSAAPIGSGREPIVALSLALGRVSPGAGQVG
jgi:hypothetical protein